jgi:adenosylhomocysteine nucleosidase
MLATVVERIAVLAPMVSELRAVVRAFALQLDASSGDANRHTGRAGDIDVVATLTGIGTRAAADTTARVISEEGVDHVMVVGIAGGVGAAVQVGDVVVPECVVDGPTGREFRGAAALTGIEARGRLVTSDDFHVEPDHLARLEADGVIALDMETAAVAEVCEREGCGWSVVRAISDRANDHPIGAAAVDLARADGRPNLPGVLRYVAKNPRKVPDLVRLGRDSQVAANAAAKAAAREAARLG